MSTPGAVHNRRKMNELATYNIYPYYNNSSKPVALNLFTEGSQIQTYDFVREPH